MDLYSVFNLVKLTSVTPQVSYIQISYPVLNRKAGQGLLFSYGKTVVIIVK